MASRTKCIIRVAGKDYSSELMPRLISLSVTDKAGASSDSIDITLDDTDGQLTLPGVRAAIEVELGNGNGDGAAFVFRGVLDEVRSSGSRSQGRTLTISGKGFDSQGKPKQPQQKHWDDRTLGDVLQEAAELGGVKTIKVDSQLASIHRPYWAMQGESFIHFAERIAREVGGTFKVANDVAILALRNGGTAPSGEALAVIRAAYGENLISWDISPLLGRPRYAKAKARWYDRKQARWRTEEVEIEDRNVDAEFADRFVIADDKEAKGRAGSRKAESERGRGGGSITINGDASAKPEGTVIVSGTRPGIDGAYRIDAVNQDFSRSSGWVTRLDLKQPHEGAGEPS